VHVDPRLDGVAVLGGGGAEDEQVVDLGEDVLVDGCAAFLQVVTKS